MATTFFPMEVPIQSTLPQYGSSSYVLDQVLGITTSLRPSRVLNTEEEVTLDQHEANTKGVEYLNGHIHETAGHDEFVEVFLEYDSKSGGDHSIASSSSAKSASEVPKESNWMTFTQEGVNAYREMLPTLEDRLDEISVAGSVVEVALNNQSLEEDTNSSSMLSLSSSSLSNSSKITKDTSSTRSGTSYECGDPLEDPAPIRNDGQHKSCDAIGVEEKVLSMVTLVSFENVHAKTKLCVTTEEDEAEQQVAKMGAQSKNPATLAPPINAPRPHLISKYAHAQKSTIKTHEFLKPSPDHPPVDAPLVRVERVASSFMRDLHSDDSRIRKVLDTGAEKVLKVLDL